MSLSMATSPKPDPQIRYESSTSIGTTYVISSPYPMFDHLLESSQRDDSNKWSNIGYDEEIRSL